VIEELKLKRTIENDASGCTEDMYNSTFQRDGDHFKAFRVPLQSLKYGTIPTALRVDKSDVFKVGLPEDRFEVME
jgi:hypothetical protein